MHKMPRKILALIFLILFFCPALLADTYPKIDVTGSKKWEYRDVNVDPQANYFQGITHLGGFSPFATGGPWQEKLTLKILTQLTDKLTLTYDIEQVPESPDSYNVGLNYDNKHALVFGDFGATFSGNEFASASKSLNGMMVTSRDQGYDLILVPSAKLKSYVQGITRQNGNNTRGPYSLGNGSIIESSERIELNGVLLERGKDYLIDYMEGKVTFTRILTKYDEFTYSYEYTNITDLFFPAISKKDFFGFQGRFKLDPNTWGVKRWDPQRITLTAIQGFPTFGRDTRIKEGSAAERIKEEEESGRFRLIHYPVIPFSETLLFRGAALDKDRDYLIDYDRGEITLLTSTLPNKDDPLWVSYHHNKVAEVVEYLPGEGGRGPYVLSNRNLVPQSEEIYINERLVTRDYDYLIDYENGRLIFNFEVPGTANLKCKYRYAAMEEPPPPPPPEVPQELTLGMIYLKESARPGLGAPTANITESDSIKGKDIIANDNTLYLSNFPLVPTSEGGTLIISDGTRTLTRGVDYIVPTVEADPQTGYARVTPSARLAYINDRMDLSDGWDTGTIKILTTLEADAQISLTYTYYKSVVSRFTGTGNGGRGPYYIRNYTNLIPGTERVEVWETGRNPVTYVRNSSFEADAGDLGYSINYYKDTPYLTFNKELSPDRNFSVYFQYVPPSSPIGSQIAQEVCGLDADYKLGDFLNLNLELAQSKKDQVLITVATVEAATFTPPTNKVSVTQHATPAIVEGTEKVYVNGYLRNRDIDYVINYDTGEISFYYITLTSADRVSVEYEYPDPGGIGTAEEKRDSAFKYGVSTNLGGLSLAYNERAVGFDFIPMGGTSLGQGSSRRDFSADYSAGFHGLSTHFDYRETKDPQTGSRERFTYNYNRNYSVSLNPYGLAGMSMSLRNSETHGDPLVAGGTPTARSELNEYAGTLSPPSLSLFMFSYDHSYDGKLADSRDFLGSSFSRSKYFHTRHGLGMNRIKLGADYAFSEPYTLSNCKTTQEAMTSRSITKDLSYDLSLDLTFPLVLNWISYAKVLDHEETTHLPTPAYLKTRNLSYYTVLTPFSRLNIRQDYSRQETPSVLVEGKNPMSENNTTKVKLRPLDNLSTNWEHSEDATIHESGRESSGRSDNYGAGWTMISTDNFNLDSSFSKSIRTATAPSGSLEAVKSDTDSFTQSYGMTYTPFSFLSLSSGFSQEDYKYESDIEETLQARSQTGNIGLSYNPIPGLGASLAYSSKATSTPTEKPRYKENLGISLNYRIHVLDWGEIVLSHEEEHNGGEVQAGGSLAHLDYKKTTQTIGLNLSIPQDHPILTSLVFSLSYKMVDFDNCLPGRDSEDFRASLLKFESSVNF
jgi:hypothetical protein